MQESRDWVSSQASSGPRGKLGFSSHSLAGTTPDLDSNHLIRDLDSRNLYCVFFRFDTEGCGKSLTFVWHVPDVFVKNVLPVFVWSVFVIS